MKIRVKKIGDDNKPLPYNKEHYASWGDEGETAFKQGWYPETNFNGETTYRSRYDLFNKVQIPTQQGLGHLAIVGKGNAMDVVIRDAKGNVAQTVMQKASPKAVQQYLTSQQNIIAQRANAVQQGTNIDRPDAKGTFAAY